MSIDQQKKELRRQIKNAKKLIPKEQREKEATNVFGDLAHLSAFKQANHVLCYWSLPDELSTHEFVNRWYVDKVIYLPKVVGEKVEIIRYSGRNSLQQGAYGIMEPAGDGLVDWSVIDLVIVPGIAFTTNGNRMGRGGGYYDRLLPQLSQALKVGVAYKCQIVAFIPCSEHDVSVDKVIF